MSDIYFVVATCGNGLSVRQVGNDDLTLYADREIGKFETLAEAISFSEANDADYYDDELFYNQNQF